MNTFTGKWKKNEMNLSLLKATSNKRSNKTEELKWN
jgi:hypothetical protein